MIFHCRTSTKKGLTFFTKFLQKKFAISWYAEDVFQVASAASPPRRTQSGARPGERRVRAVIERFEKKCLTLRVLARIL